MSRKARFGLLVLLVLLLVSLSLNVFLYLLSINYYHDAESVRLDPTSRRFFETQNAQLPPPGSGEKRIVLLGDSRIEQWEPALTLPNCQFVNRGRGGDTTAQVLLRLERDVLALKPNVVVVQVGINDLKAIGSFPEREAEIVADCSAHLETLIARLRHAQITVVVLTVFPIGDVALARRPIWSEATRTAVETVNTRLKQLQSADVTVVDCTSILAVDGRLKSEYARDDFHLRSTGYEALNEALRPELLRTIGRP